MLLLGTALAFLYFYINPSNVNFLPKCPLYITTGFYCPGCGSQRATHHLLNFNFLGVIQQNILFIFWILFAVYYLIIEGVNLIFKKNIYNYLYHKKTPIIILIFVLIFWVVRNIPHEPFNWLAPN